MPNTKIQNEIDRIKGNVADAYSAIEAKGGTVPEEPNSDNLPDAIYSIPEGESAQTYILNAPIGAIIAWSGTVDDIPTGWHICDGNEGTRDLRDTFILGAGEKHPVGETGGSEEVTLTVEQLAKHNHRESIPALTAYKTTTSTSSSAVALYTIMSSNVTDTGSSQPHPNMPPYYALLFIQKISDTPTDYVTREEVEEMTGIPVRAITKEEYNALSEEEKNIETAWMVTDANSGSSGGSGAGEVYSTEETRIGTWIDGKPLYRRTVSKKVSVGSAGSTFYTLIPYSEAKTFLLTNAHGFATTDIDIKFQIPSSSTDNLNVFPKSVFVCYDSGLCLFIDFTEAFSAANAYLNYAITIEYTKTTD